MRIIRNGLLFAFVLVAPMAITEPPPFPMVDAEYYVVEKMLVKPEKLEWFVGFWRNTMLPVFEQIDGWRGGYVSTVLPPTGEAPPDFPALLPFGPPDTAFLPHDGLQLNGVVTNTQIHFEALLRGTYNFVVVHYWRDAEALENLLPAFTPAWNKVHPGQQAWRVLEEEYFTNLENHWDTAYRIVR